MSESGWPLTELAGLLVGSLWGTVPSFLIYKPNAVLTQQWK